MARAFNIYECYMLMFIWAGVLKPFTTVPKRIQIIKKGKGEVLPIRISTKQKLDLKVLSTQSKFNVLQFFDVKNRSIS